MKNRGKVSRRGNKKTEEWMGGEGMGKSENHKDLLK